MKNVYLFTPETIGVVRPEVHGFFTEHIGGVYYDGLYVGKDSAVPNIRGFRKDLVESLQKLTPSVLRWPGGCFAESYDWRDGIGTNRPRRPSWWTVYDGRVESNAVGTHEFMDLCELVGAQGYFAANLTAVTPMHIRNWMDYCLSPKGSTTLAEEREQNGHPEPFDIPYWGVGNENWGGGGNMLPEHYGNLFRTFSAQMCNLSPKAQLFLCGTDGANFDWTRRLLPVLATSERHCQGYAMHFYCRASGDALHFDKAQWKELLCDAARMEDIILRNWGLIAGYQLEQHCALVVDEWGCWHPEGSGPSRGYNLYEQQSTMRDAMVTALTLNIFHNHADKVRMANVAQMVNNLHALFLAGGDRCITTPTYHVFDLYQCHKGATAFRTFVPDNSPEDGLTVSASRKDGRTFVSIGNLSCEQEAEITLCPAEGTLPDKGTLRLLTAQDMHAHNTFEEPDTVTPVTRQVNPNRPLTLPPFSVCTLTF